MQPAPYPAGMLRACPAHGPFEGARCPTCAHEGTPLATEKQRTRLSKFLSGALRHFPDDVGLELDENGWGRLDALVGAAGDRYPFADPETVHAVLDLDPKGRFEVDEDEARVRARYGHTVDVEVEAAPGPVPDTLFHGTAPSNLDAILEEGLQPMGRQAVHLSLDRATAREVGHRHAEHPALLRVDTTALDAAGIEVRRRAQTVFTCPHVPPDAIEVDDPGGAEEP